MSYDGPVVSGWGAIARTEDQAHQVVRDLSNESRPATYHLCRLLQFGHRRRRPGPWGRVLSAALDATEEPRPSEPCSIYRLLRLPDAEIRVPLQRTDDKKVSKNGCTWTWRPTILRSRSNAWSARRDPP